MNYTTPSIANVRSSLTRLGVLALAAIALVLVGCSGAAGGIGGGGGGGGFVPDVANTWEGFDSSGRKISLLMFAVGNPSGQGQASGTLDGSLSLLTIYDATDNPPPATAISGSYNGADISLMLASASAPLVSSYNAHFSDRDTLVLRPAAGMGTELTLRRSGFFTAKFVDNWNGTAGGQPWLIQLGTAVGYDETSSARIEGTEYLNGRMSRVTGYVNIQAVHLVIERSTGSVTLDGQFPKNGTVTNGEQITFNGATLSRGGPADSQKVILLANTNLVQQLHMADAKGNEQLTLVPPPSGAAPVYEYSISPNRQTVVSLGAGAIGANLYVTNLATKQSTQMTVATGSTAAVIQGSLKWAPDSSHLAFELVESGSDAPDIVVLRMSDLQTIPLTQAVAANASGPNYEWAPGTIGPPTLAFAISETAGATSTNLSVYRFDTATRVSITTLPVGRHVIGMSWSADRSRLAFVSNLRAAGLYETFVAISANGVFSANTYSQILPLLSTGQATTEIRWSPDSTRLAMLVQKSAQGWRELRTVAAGATQSDVVSDFAGGTMASDDVTRFTWSPDSARIAFFAFTPAAPSANLFVAQADGAGAPLPISTSGAVADYAPAWSPDGQKIVYWPWASGGSYDIAVANADGTGNHVLHSAGMASGCTPSQSLDWLPSRWSPNGAHIASVVVTGNSQGDCALRVIGLDGTGRTLDVRNYDLVYGATASEYFWMPDSTRIVYVQTTYRDAFQWGEVRVGVAGDAASLRIFGKRGEDLPSAFMSPL